MNGSWVAPISFMDAYKMPKQMLDIFFELDSISAKLAKQETGK